MDLIISVQDVEVPMELCDLLIIRLLPLSDLNFFQHPLLELVELGISGAIDSEKMRLFRIQKFLWTNRRVLSHPWDSVWIFLNYELVKVNFWSLHHSILEAGFLPSNRCYLCNHIPKICPCWSL